MIMSFFLGFTVLKKKRYISFKIGQEIESNKKMAFE
jgi:hypothetical protein